MLKKVLIAEDHEMINSSIQRTLEDFGIHQTDHVYYCDDALTRIKKAYESGDPYDLLITDLSFDEDHRNAVIKDGRELILAARKVHPHLKVMVFSGENRSSVIDELITKWQINAYVMKARRDAQQLREALEALSQNRKCYPHFRQSLPIKNTYNFTELDIVLVELLSVGHLQKELPAILQHRNIKPSGLSSIEKRIKNMKEALNFSTTEQLIAYCKDIGII